MAEFDSVPSFGNDLKDGFKVANGWVAHGISWLDDLQQFYRDRSAIEKEYSARLSALSKRYYEKKNKRSVALTVGDTPTMTPGSLESVSLNTWTSQLNTLEARASEHDRYGNDLVARVAEPLKGLAGRLEEVRKKHVEYSERLARERETAQSELRKVKVKYDAVCQDVEHKRKKAEGALDKAKAQSSYQQQVLEMNNVKNSYLIAINVHNKYQERYYNEYVPELMESLQDLSEFRTLKVNELWTLSATLEDQMLQASHGMMETTVAEVARNDPHLDSAMFVQHNVGNWTEPEEKVFEPSPVWHDDETIVVDETAKVYLRNLLHKSKSQLSELRREVDKKRRELDGLKQLKQAVREGREKRDEVDLVRQIFALQEELHLLEYKRLAAEVETSSITTAVGDVTLGARNHNFKAQTFKIPTNCDLCGERIWGLSAKGFDCRDCGYTCHSKCEMKVPAECPGEQTKEARKKLKAERQEAANKLLTMETSTAHVDLPSLSRTNTMTSLSSGYARSHAGSATHVAAPDDSGREASSTKGTASASTATSRSETPPTSTANRLKAPPPASYISASSSSPGLPPALKPPPLPGTEAKGKMLYAFKANGPGELTLPEGREVMLLEADDGSGWLRVRAGYKEGIVPASYVEVMKAEEVPAPPPPIPERPVSVISSSGSSIGGKKKGPAVVPRRGAKKLRYVEAVYEYAAQTDAEHSMEVGERFVLIKEDPGDGWTDVEKGGVTKSVPASYLQEV